MFSAMVAAEAMRNLGLVMREMDERAFERTRPPTGYVPVTAPAPKEETPEAPRKGKRALDIPI